MYSPGTCVLGKGRSEQVTSHVRLVGQALKSLSSSRPPLRLTLDAWRRLPCRWKGSRKEGNGPQLIEDADSGAKAPTRDTFSPVC